MSSSAQQTALASASASAYRAARALVSAPDPFHHTRVVSAFKSAESKVAGTSTSAEAAFQTAEATLSAETRLARKQFRSAEDALRKAGVSDDAAATLTAALRKGLRAFETAERSLSAETSMARRTLLSAEAHLSAEARPYTSPAAAAARVSRAMQLSAEHAALSAEYAAATGIDA